MCHQSSLYAGDIQANSPIGRPLAASSPVATAPATRTNALTSSSLSTSSPVLQRLAANSSVKPATSVRAQEVPATSANGLGAASGPSSARGPATSGSLSLLQPEQYNSALEAPEDQGTEDRGDEEDSEDGPLSDDDDISSWGSHDEIWGSDSDYCDTDEEGEALVGQLFVGTAVHPAHAVQAACCDAAGPGRCYADPCILGCFASSFLSTLWFSATRYMHVCWCCLIDLCRKQDCCHSARTSAHACRHSLSSVILPVF